MAIGFDNILDHVIPLENFSLKWRFTDDSYNQLPQLHLDELKPLDDEASQFLWNFIADTKLHSAVPFKKDFFTTVDKVEISEGNETEVKNWLYQRGLPFDKEVYLSWQPSAAMIVPLKLLIKYYDDFYYAIADDLTVIDQSLNWALVFYHEHEIYFGNNQAFVPTHINDDINFL